MMLAAPGNDIIRPNIPDYTKGGIISRRDLVWCPVGDRIPFAHLTNPSERRTHIPQDKSIGTISEVIMVRPPSIVQQDTYLDNEVGYTIRYIKEKFGSAPLLKAYQGALDTLEESNRRWKEYYEEEARQQSLFEDED